MKGYSISTVDVHEDLIICGINDQKFAPKEQECSLAHHPSVVYRKLRNAG
jgi:hypothetical protein